MKGRQKEVRAVEENRLLADSPVNRGRQLELDIIKGLAILFMLLVHCLECFIELPWEPTWANRLIYFLGCPPAAPVFMFALGVGLVYSRKNSPRDLAVRGLRILLLGYVLAFFRDFLSMYVLYLRSGSAAELTEGVNEFLGVDILPFAGLTFLFFAGAAKLRFQNIHYIAAALIGGAANLLLMGTSFSSPLLNHFGGLIWGTTEYSWFPFLTWITYPILGYLFGQLLIRCRDKTRLYKICLWVSLPAVLAGGLLYRHYGLYFGWEDYHHTGAYWHHNLLGNLLFASFVVAWTSLAYFAAAKLPEVVVKTLSRWSRNITVMYVIHWMIVSWSIVVLPLPFTLPWILAYFVVLVPVTDAAAVGYLALKGRLFPRAPAGRAAA